MSDMTGIVGALLVRGRATPSLPDLPICPKHLPARVRAALEQKRSAA